MGSRPGARTMTVCERRVLTGTSLPHQLNSAHRIPDYGCRLLDLSRKPVVNSSAHAELGAVGTKKTPIRRIVVMYLAR
jgi:hypothetical protein